MKIIHIMKSKKMNIKELAIKSFNYMMKGNERSFSLALAGCNAKNVLKVNEELDLILKRWRGENV